MTFFVCVMAFWVIFFFSFFAMPQSMWDPLLLFSLSVGSDSLWLHRLQHARSPCLPPSPRVNQTQVHWVNVAIQPSHPLSPLLLLPSIFPASGSFPMSQLFVSGGASASVLPMNIQGWFPLGLTGLILQSKGLSRVFSNTTVQKHQFFSTHSLWSNSYYLYKTTGKTIAFTIPTFVGKEMSVLFNTLSKFVVTFLPRSKHLLISWLQSPCAVILKPMKIKFHCFHFFPHLFAMKW